MDDWIVDEVRVVRRDVKRLRGVESVGLSISREMASFGG